MFHTENAAQREDMDVEESCRVEPSSSQPWHTSVGEIHVVKLLAAAM
jgi:hypothetical protein